MAKCECFSEHFSRKHFLSGIDARIKLLVALALLLMVLSYKGTFFPLLVSGGALMLCMKMRIPFKAIFTRMAQPFLIASVVLLLKLLFSGEEVMFSINLMGLKLSGHKDGLM